MKTLSVRFSKQTFLLFGFVCLAMQFAGCGGTKGFLKVTDILDSYANEASNAFYPTSCRKACQFFDERISRCNVDPECLKCYVGVINQYGYNPGVDSYAQSRCPTRQLPDPSTFGITVFNEVPCVRRCHYLQIHLCERGLQCESCSQYFINNFPPNGQNYASQYCENPDIPTFTPDSPGAIVPGGPTIPRPSASYGLPARNG
ncbi:uncharacterized protein LOC143024365 [Oratosquilla oratoria]|uniref:uncharacterized protein LOC143024365 n=1 Tax=Oratosquilla oratoria TaxID=337810 RepID=UPI003F7728F3